MPDAKDQKLHLAAPAKKTPGDLKPAPEEIESTGATIHKSVKGGMGMIQFAFQCFGSEGAVYGISAEDMTKVLMAKAGSVDFAIIDLRCNEDFKDTEFKGLQLANALHFPLQENPQPGYIDYATLRDTHASAKAQWEALSNKPPFKSVLAKKYVIFHCAQSTNRTPNVASGYLAFAVGRRADQRVIILEDGALAYVKSPGALTQTVYFAPATKSLQ